MTTTHVDEANTANGHTPAEGMQPSSALGRWRRHSNRMLPVLATIPMFAGIFALALAVEHPGEAVSVLYTIPIAVIATERGPWAGLAAAGAALGLFGIGLAISGEHVGVLGFVTRAVGFGVLGGLLGHYATSLRAANSEVLAREAQLLSIMDNTTAVIYLKDRKGRFIMVNRRFEDLFHVSREEIVGKTDRDIFPQYMADAYMANDRRVLKERQAIEFEEEAPQDDGPHTYISVKFPLVHPGEQQPYALCGISTDISVRKRAEKDLRDSKDRFRQILDTCNEAFVSINEAGAVVAWNRAAEATFGWPAARAIGSPITELVVPERYCPSYDVAVQRYLETGKAPILDKRIALVARHRDGHEFPVEVTINAVRVPGGHRFNAFVQDVSNHPPADSSYLIDPERSGVGS